MQIGVKLFLQPGTRVPSWIRNQTLNIELGYERLNKRKVRFLKICNGEAFFFAGGGVMVKMPGSDKFWVAFSPMRVLEIRDLENNLIERNHYLCTECVALTGEKKNYQQSNVSGLVDATFACTRCGHRWELKRI